MILLQSGNAHCYWLFMSRVFFKGETGGPGQKGSKGDKGEGVSMFSHCGLSYALNTAIFIRGVKHGFSFCFISQGPPGPTGIHGPAGPPGLTVCVSQGCLEFCVCTVCVFTVRH